MDEFEDKANVAEGIGALMRVLGCIGSGGTEHDVAQIVVEKEMKLRAVLSYAVRQMARHG